MDNNLEYFIDRDLKNIFGEVNLSTLSNYQKRQMIFDYLSKNLSYDWSLYLKILRCSLDKSRLPRNFKLEMSDIIKNHKGVCIAIASYYKLLLRRVNINSLIIGTSDETPVFHVLNLVYNSDTNTYSFDDVTSMLTRFRNKKYCFDYDIADAYKVRQGHKTILSKGQTKWITIPSINYEDNIGRTHFDQVEDQILSLKKKS